MFGIFLGFHVLICILLILVVLLQRSRGAGLSGVFGGGGSQSFFGGRGAAPFLTKATSVLAILFMATSLTLTLISARRGSSKTAIQKEMEKGLPASPPATEVVPLLQKPPAPEGTEETKPLEGSERPAEEKIPQ